MSSINNQIVDNPLLSLLKLRIISPHMTADEEEKTYSESRMKDPFRTQIQRNSNRENNFTKINRRLAVKRMKTNKNRLCNS